MQRIRKFLAKPPFANGFFGKFIDFIKMKSELDVSSPFGSLWYFSIYRDNRTKALSNSQFWMSFIYAVNCRRSLTYYVRQ